MTRVKAWKSSRSVMLSMLTTEPSGEKRRAVRLPKPMGLILEEMEGSEPGVYIVDYATDGAAAKMAGKGADFCIGDRLVAIQSEPCADWTFEQVMDYIISQTADEIELTLEQPSDRVVVRFAHNGIQVLASPGDVLGFVCNQAKAKIPYKCQEGACGTCEQIMVATKDGEASPPQYVRPCVARVPEGADTLDILPSDRMC